MTKSKDFYNVVPDVPPPSIAPYKTTAKDALEDLLGSNIDEYGETSPDLIDKIAQALHQQIIELIGRGQHISKEYLSHKDYYEQEATNKLRAEIRSKLKDYFSIEGEKL